MEDPTASNRNRTVLANNRHRRRQKKKIFRNWDEKKTTISFSKKKRGKSEKYEAGTWAFPTVPARTQNKNNNDVNHVCITTSAIHKNRYENKKKQQIKNEQVQPFYSRVITGQATDYSRRGPLDPVTTQFKTR